MLKLILCTLICLQGSLLLAQEPTLEQLKNAVVNLGINRTNIEQTLLKKYESLDARAENYDEQVDDIINQLIALKSDEAIKLCILHIDNPHNFSFSFQLDPYMSYLVHRGEKSLTVLLNYHAKATLTEKQRETYLFYAGVLLAYQTGYNKSKILKRGELLAIDYEQAVVDRVIAKALTMYPGAR